jgi:hypothetical protein
MADAEEPRTETSDADDALIQEIMNRPSSFPTLRLGIELSGFATEDVARVVGQEIGSCLFSVGKILNLERLCRVVVTYDYNGTLASLDRGFEASKPLTPTQDDLAIGIAMTPAIIQDSEPRSVMVLNAYHMIVLAHRDNPEVAEWIQRMVHTLAHECGHVHDLGVQFKAFPNEMLKAKLSHKDNVLHFIASGCWEEYIASRLSAFMGHDFTTKDFENTFCGALERARSRSDAAIRQYRMHHDLPRVIEEVTQEYKRLLVYASYLVGHTDGLGGSVQDLAPKAIDLVEHTAYFKPIFEQLVQHLRAMHSTYGLWETIEVFEPLKRLAYDLLKSGGMDIQQKPDGASYVAIPFSPETMPSVSEQFEFVSKSARKTSQ